jgi:membrane associated rhomboid family serine protease
LWRLVTSPCVFSSTPELLFGLYLVYFFRVFERQIGSNKYLVFLLFSTAFTTILEVVTLAAFRGIGYSTFMYLLQSGAFYLYALNIVGGLVILCSVFWASLPCSFTSTWSLEYLAFNWQMMVNLQLYGLCAQAPWTLLQLPALF